jgi:hypothetical protein
MLEEPMTVSGWRHISGILLLKALDEERGYQLNPSKGVRREAACKASQSAWLHSGGHGHCIANVSSTQLALCLNDIEDDEE